MSIYSTLYKLCKGQNENFLTEAFCDLLNNRMDENEKQKFIKKIFKRDMSGKIEFITQYRDKYDNNDNILAQYNKSINNNHEYINNDKMLVPDIKCINYNQEFIIEVKIDAKFTPNQINYYNKKYKDIYLITAYTKQQKDNKIFEDDHVILWKDIYKELSSSSYNSCRMVSEFTEFLVVNGWGIGMPTGNDFKKFGDFLSDNTALRISTFLKDLRTELKNKYCKKYNFINWDAYNPTNGNWGTYSFKAPSTYDYYPICHDKLKKAVIEWGFYNPGIDKDGFDFQFDEFDIERRFLVWIDIYCYDGFDAKKISEHFSNKSTCKISTSRNNLNDYPFLVMPIDFDNFDSKVINDFIINSFKEMLDRLKDYLDK